MVGGSVGARTIVLVGLPLVAAMSAPWSLWANGGTLRLSRAPAGPYLVSAWTQPAPPRVGRLDVTVAAMSPDTGKAALDVRARATAHPVGHGEPRFGARLERGAGGNLLLYHGILEVPAAGPWRVLVEVAGPAGTGQAAFDLDIQPPLPLSVPVAVVVATLLVGGALWWWGRTRTGARSR